MVDLQKLVLVLPSLLPFNYEVNTNYDCDPDYFYSNCEPPLKNIMEYNTMSMEELIEENNNKLMDDIFLRTIIEDE